MKTAHGLLFLLPSYFRIHKSMEVFEHLFIKHFIRKSGYRSSFECMSFVFICDSPFRGWALYSHCSWKGWSFTGVDGRVLLSHCWCSGHSSCVGQSINRVFVSSTPFPKHMPPEIFLNLALSLTSKVTPQPKAWKTDLKQTQPTITIPSSSSDIINRLQ